MAIRAYKCNFELMNLCVLLRYLTLVLFALVGLWKAAVPYLEVVAVAAAATKKEHFFTVLKIVDHFIKKKVTCIPPTLDNFILIPFRSIP